jgi:hypothetical protein
MLSSALLNNFGLRFANDVTTLNFPEKKIDLLRYHFIYCANQLPLTSRELSVNGGQRAG